MGRGGIIIINIATPILNRIRFDQQNFLNFRGQKMILNSNGQLLLQPFVEVSPPIQFTLGRGGIIIIFFQAVWLIKVKYMDTNIKEKQFKYCKSDKLRHLC